MRYLLTLSLVFFSGICVLSSMPETPQSDLAGMPISRRLPEPHLVYEEMRAQLRDSRATVIRASYVTYEHEEAGADATGVLLPNPKNTPEITPSPAALGTASR